LADGEYAARRSQCESALKKLKQRSWRDVTMDKLNAVRETLSATEFRRARHVVNEISRTTAAAKAIQDGNWSRAGDLMYASHVSLQADFEVSCDELDILVDIAQEMGEKHGVYGSRMTGGGFGGCTVSLVETDQAEKVMRTLRMRFEERTGIRASGFVSRPARGAHVLRGKT
jgi:galactokinase